MSSYVQGLRERIGHDLLLFPAVMCLIRDADGRFLFVRHVEGRWQFPGGAVDPGETPADAARRETREEASIEIEPLRIVGVFGGYPDFRITYANGDEAAWVATLFEARIVDGVPEPGDDETAEVRWVVDEEARALEITAATRHTLDSISTGRTFDP